MKLRRREEKRERGDASRALCDLRVRTSRPFSDLSTPVSYSYPPRVSHHCLFLVFLCEPLAFTYFYSRPSFDNEGLSIFINVLRLSINLWFSIHAFINSVVHQWCTMLPRNIRNGYIVSIGMIQCKHRRTALIGFCSLSFACKKLDALRKQNSIFHEIIRRSRLGQPHFLTFLLIVQVAGASYLYLRTSRESSCAFLILRNKTYQCFSLVVSLFSSYMYIFLFHFLFLVLCLSA